MTGTASLQRGSGDLGRVVDSAFARHSASLKGAGATLSCAIRAWEASFFGGVEPREAFARPMSFPMFLLPWWAEGTLGHERDLLFQADLAYSTLNGYYYIRLIDDVMDGDRDVDLSALPALGFFHTEFTGPYRKYFAYDHHFWRFFEETWFGSADVTIRDARAKDLDQDEFTSSAARKTVASKIPVAAVCHRYGHSSAFAPWSEFIDALGRWSQFANDLRDWQKDLRYRHRTYFLWYSESRRRKSESIESWIIREGIRWGIERLEAWGAECVSIAAKLECPELQGFLASRERAISSEEFRSFLS